MKKSILLIFLMVVSIGFASAVCTVSFDDSYNQQETITATMTCSGVAEKNDDYTLNWTNSTGYVIQSDSGTTPSQINTNFFESYIIDSDFVNLYGENITATLSGGDTEGSDTANITSASSNSLIIKDVELSSQFLVGRAGGIHFKVVDENDKEISNARCSIEILDGDNKPVIVSETLIVTVDGEIGFSTKEITPNFFLEGTSYAFRTHCSCGSNSTVNGCWDEDGLTISESSGSGVFSFDIGTWLTSNTVVNNENYVGREEMFICANVTNVEFEKRIPMEIYHQVRCSAGIDNDNDTDRALIFSDDGKPDERGISTNTTQEQCKRFVIPEPKFLQGTSSQCYASTSVWVLNEQRQRIMNYVTSSPVFNITINDLNIDPDWEVISNHTFNTIINLSDKKHSIFNGAGTGNIDIRVDKQYTESIRAEDQFLRYPQQIHSFTNVNSIKSITVLNSTGGVCEHAIEILDDGNIEIEVRDVDISQSGWLNVTMVIENFEERQTEALEGIENKTGTFHLSIDCPAQASEGDQLTCQLNAQIEESQTVEKEVDFTCYILDPITNAQHSTINFNQMINKTLYSVNKSFTVPTIGTGEKQVVCKANYYNLGSRTDTFSDTFLIPNLKGGSGIGTSKAEDIFNEISKVMKDILTPTDDKVTDGIIYFAIILVALFSIIIIAVRKRKCKK